MGSGSAAEDGRRKYLTCVKYFWKIWKYRGNLTFMDSKSGVLHDVRNRGRRGHRNLKGRALSASHINSLEKFADQNHRENGAGSVNKNGENSFIEAKRGHEGFFGKEERQPNCRGGRTEAENVGQKIF